MKSWRWLVLRAARCCQGVCQEGDVHSTRLSSHTHHTHGVTHGFGSSDPVAIHPEAEVRPVCPLHYTPRHPTALQRCGEVELSGPVTLRASDEEGILRAAFRDAHGARLNGFALLVT